MTKKYKFDEDEALSLAERTFSTEIDEQLASDIIQYASRLHSRLQVNQQTEPDVTALVDALEGLVELVEDYRQGEYILDSLTTQPARIALATYREQRGDL